MIQFFTEPLQYAFMREALVAGGLCAAMCAVLSCFLVLRGWSLMGDAISHAVLPGIVLAYVVGIPLSLGAFLAGLGCAVGTGYIKLNSRLKEDTVMGVVFTAMFAFGTVLLTKTTSDVHLDHILLGSILGITRAQFVQTCILSVVVLVAALVLRKDLLMISFDPGHARVIALRTRFLHYALLVMLALGIVVTLQTTGMILVIAMLITPGCTGYLWTDRFDRMVLIAISTSLASTLLGILISYQADASTSACIVLTQSLLFATSLMVAPKYGLIARRR